MGSRHLKWLIFCTAAMLAAAPANAAQGETVSSTVEFNRQADALRPGQWVWAPSIAPEGPVTVYVDLSRQIATVYRNGVRIGVSTVSSGRPGHSTPTGVFTILQKDPNHHSSRYNDAPMPFQERLTWDGVALHAGGLPGYPESHGCVHLPLEFSRLLFGVTHLGDTVIVAGSAGGPLIVQSAGIFSPAGNASHVPLAGNQEYRWTPQAAPSGPLTIVVSRSDQRVVVMRNGIEIGRARAELPNGNFETHVLTYARGTDGGERWIYVGVPGHDAEAGRPLDATVLSQVRLPGPFLADLRAAIVPGTTILVTEAPVLPHTTGPALTVLDSQGTR